MHVPTGSSGIRAAVESHECTLRKLAIRDDAFIEGLLASGRANLSQSGLDPKSHALVRLGALIAVDAASPSYRDAVESARQGGASDQQPGGWPHAGLPEIAAR